MFPELVPCALFAMVAVSASFHIPQSVHVVSQFVRHKLSRLAIRWPRVATTAYVAAMGGSIVFITSHPALYAYEAFEQYAAVFVHAA